MKIGWGAFIVGILVLAVGLSSYHLCWFRTHKVVVSLDGVSQEDAMVFCRKGEYAVRPFPRQSIYYLVRPAQQVVGIPSDPFLMESGLVLIAKKANLPIVDVRSPKIDKPNARLAFSADRIEFSDIDGHLLVVELKHRERSGVRRPRISGLSNTIQIVGGLRAPTGKNDNQNIASPVEYRCGAVGAFSDHSPGSVLARRCLSRRARS